MYALMVCNMCEFTVFLNKEIVYRDVVYAKTEGNNVLLKDVLGATKKVDNCRIVEVDVSSERLVLA
jgi:predicted RNA-binding protein